jgi:peptidyl-prolyl cis-trans isomerase SurA
MTPLFRPSTFLASAPLRRRWRAGVCAALLLSVGLSATAQGQRSARSQPRTADYILAVVNHELVTAGEVQQRIARIRAEAQREGTRLPPEEQLRQEVLETLIDERAQVTLARDTGVKVDDAEVDRAIQSIATQNQLTIAQLRERLQADGIDYGRFRTSLRDQMLVERVREREVISRIRVSDQEIDDYLQKQRGPGGSAREYNIAQILITVPEGASGLVEAARRSRAEAVLARVRGGEAFDTVAREVSEDNNKARGGEIGLRPASRLPELFVDAVKTLKNGEVAPGLLRSPAGFHVLKLIEQRDPGTTVMQTRARHILLRPAPPMTQEAAVRRLQGFKRQIETGVKSFEQIARESSQDGSAPQGGDLGWVGPGKFVPEFEEAMNALPINGLSEPVLSRFGVHLIQVTERRQVDVDPKQLRDQARASLREQKFETAYADWLRELRSRSYIEMREPPP